MSKQLPPEAYELLDQRDEEQILAEIKGEIITEMFYEFPLEGKTVTGVSWVGTKEISRKYGGITMGLPKVDDLGDHYAATIQATDKRNDVTLVGTAMQPKNMTLKGGQVKPDVFAYTKAVSKAQRNAIRALIPERYLIEMYQLFKERAQPKPAASAPVRRDASYTVAAQTPGEPVLIRDLASLNAWLLNHGAPLEVGGAPVAEEVDGVLTVRSPPGVKLYELLNTALREEGFTWVSGGYRWEREA